MRPLVNIVQALLLADRIRSIFELEEDLKRMEGTRTVLLAVFMQCSLCACERETRESTAGIGDIVQNSASRVEGEIGVERSLVRFLPLDPLTIRRVKRP